MSIVFLLYWIVVLSIPSWLAMAATSLLLWWPRAWARRAGYGMGPFHAAVWIVGWVTMMYFIAAWEPRTWLIYAWMTVASCIVLSGPQYAGRAFLRWIITQTQPAPP